MTPHSPRWIAEPMILLVVGIPLTAVIVSFTFLGIAIKSFDGVVEDDYYRQGKEINRLLLRDDTARRLQLTADLQIGDGQVTARLTAAQTLDWPASLRLRLLHPTRDGRDVTVELAQATDIPQRYAAKLPAIATGEWIVQIDTPTWRLMKRGRFGHHSAILLDANSD